MKKHFLLAIALFPLLAFGQLKEIVFAELTAGSGMYFGAQMSTTDITVTVQGPDDRFIAFGFGTGMANGNDAIIYSTLGTGAAPQQLRDHKMVGQGVEPTVDAQQDWSVISNTTSGGNRTIVATRALSTGDADDITFNFSNTSQMLFWSKGPFATFQLQYHGGSNRASGIVRNWTLVDQTPPIVNTFTPADNASGVSLTANLIMSFNENISWGTGSVTLYDENNNVVQSVSNGSAGVTITGSTFVFNPTANFIPGTDYYVHVDADALKDAAGNFFAGFSDNTTWNFNTNDVTAPVLAATPFQPADNAAAVALNTNLVVTLNENVQLGTGLIELFDGTNTLVESFDVATSPLVTVSNASVTVNPTSDLIINNAYYVHIANGAIKDIAGNNYAGFSNNTTWNFNTNDLGAPVAAPPFIPADNATNAPTNGQLRISFNENIAVTATGAVKIYLLAGSTLVETLDNTNPGIVVVNNELQINAAALNELTNYYVTIDAGFVTDLSANAFAGFTDNATWSFMTGDFTAPALIVSPFSPADNATQVPINTTLSISFNEPVFFGSGEIHLANENTGATLDFDVSTSSDVSVTGAMVTITPPANLGLLTGYHVTIDAGAILDAASNAYAGISDTTVWNFQTDDDSGLGEYELAGISWNGTVLTIDPATPFTAHLYDAAGKLIRSNLGTETICSDLTPGIYLVGILRENRYQTVRLYVR